MRGDTLGTMTRAWVVATTLVLGSSALHAQPADPRPAPAGPPSAAPVGSPATPPPSPGPPSSTVDPGVIDDANAGRGWLSPTALTEPGGTWSVSDYELFLLSIGYAVNDRLSLSATTIPPLTTDFPLWLLFNAKLQVLKAGRVRAALQGAVTYFSANDSSDDSFTAGDLGGALTLCLDDACHSNVSGFLGAGLARDTGNSAPFLAAGTLVARLGRYVKLVTEVDTAFIAGQVNDVANGALLWYGLRFTSSRIGVDLGFVRPIGIADSSFVVGLPVVTFSYRNID